jgi:hypothetical protein
MKEFTKSQARVHAKESSHTWWNLVAHVSHDNVRLYMGASQDSHCETSIALQEHFPAISRLDNFGLGGAILAQENWAVT